jgi:hypothetical protein
VSTAPARAASVRTLVVSWKLAAEMNDSDWRLALVMPRSSVLARAGLGRLPLAGSLPAAFGGVVGLAEGGLVDDLVLLEVRAAGLADLEAGLHGVVGGAEAELVDDLAGEELRIAGIFDLHLAEHLVEDDLDVLVVDLHALAAVDVLDLDEEVLVERLLALDAEDVVGDERPADERVAGLDVVAGVDLELLVLGDVVLAFHAGLGADDDRHLSAALLGAELDGAGDLGQDGRVLGLAGLEDLGHAGEAAGDVHGARGFLGLAREELTGLDLLAGRDFDTGLGGEVVEVEDLAVVALDGDARVALALVLDDDHLGLAGLAALALFLDADGLALFDVLVADDAALLGENGRDVRVPADELLARLDLLAVAGEDGGAVGDLVLLELAALGVGDDDLAVALEGDEALVPSASLTSTALMSRCSTVPPLTLLMSFSMRLDAATPPVWNVRIVSWVPARRSTGRR